MNKKNENKKNENVTEIIKELGLEKLSKKRQDDILAKIGELILKKIFVETVDKLEDVDRRKFEKMLEAKTTADDIEKFLSTKIKDYDKMVEVIVDDLKKEIKGNL